jgi:hypothetical protein
MRSLNRIYPSTADPTEVTLRIQMIVVLKYLLVCFRVLSFDNQTAEEMVYDKESVRSADNNADIDLFADIWPGGMFFMFLSSNHT